ncbi:aldo/keto reductase [Serratia fonticola]|nr:aldo/keto reductase [Serratia fonticola]
MLAIRHDSKKRNPGWQTISGYYPVPAVTFPIIGVTSVEQLTDNIRSVEIALEEHEISALEEFYTPHSTAELE